METLKERMIQMGGKMKKCGSVLEQYKNKMLQYEAKTKAAEKCFAPELTQFEMNTLDAFCLSKKSDRQFMTAVLKILYKENEEEIRGLVLSVNKKTGLQAKPIPPEKIANINMLMRRRASKVHDALDQINRMSDNYIRKIISETLYYFKNRSKKSKKCP